MLTPVYHGTVKAYLPQIKKSGLHPSLSHAWHITGLNPEKNVIFFTPQKERAVQYAETKAKYLGKKPGESFTMYNERMMALEKEQTAPVIETEPILLHFHIDLDDDNVTEDPEDPKGYRFHGTIPFSKIEKVEMLPVLYKPEDDRPMTDDEEREEIVKELHELLGI